MLSLLAFCIILKKYVSFKALHLFSLIFNHFLQDSVSLDAVLKETVNRPPFIIQIEDSFHVVVDNQVLVTSNSVSEALLNVFSSYYVFYIEYSKQVLKSLLFLQSEVLGLKNDCSIKCPGLPLFVNTLNAVKLQLTLCSL